MSFSKNLDKPVDRPIASRWIPGLIDVVERATIIIAFVVFLFANYDPSNWLNFVVAATDIITVWFILFRNPATSTSPDPQDWILAFGGTLLALLARPGGQPLIPPAIAFSIAMGGAYISLVAKLSLRRSFGIVPANRGVRMRGAYVFLRHPMYFGYAVTHTAYLLMNPTLFNAMLICATWACQLGRIMREERWLMQDRAYRRYARVVRFRLIPGLF